MEVDEEQIYIQHFSWGLLVEVLLAVCGLVAWKRWSCTCIYEFVCSRVYNKSVEELYTSPQLGVDSADTS
jgi:hypothetical protein